MKKKTCLGLVILNCTAGYLAVLGESCGAEEKKVDVALAVKEEYTDNVFWTSANRKSEDWITTVSPMVRFAQKDERLDAGLNVTVDALSYVDNNGLNDVNQQYDGAFSYLITSLFRLRTSATYILDSRNDLDISNTGLVLEGTSVRRTRQHYLAGGDYMLSEKLTMNLNYDFYQDTYDDSRFTDYRAHLMGGGLSYDLEEFSPNTTVRTSLGYGSYTFLTSTVENYTWTVGGTKRLSETWSVDVDAGVRETSTDFINSRIEYFPPFLRLVRFEDSSENFGGLGSVAINYRGETTGGKMMFSYDVQPASGRDGATKRTALKFNVWRHLTEDLRVSLWSEYFINKSDTGDFGTLAVDEKTWQIAPQISYDFTDELKIECRYQFSTITRPAANNDVERNLVFARLTYTYPLFE